MIQLESIEIMSYFLIREKNRKKRKSGKLHK